MTQATGVIDIYLSNYRKYMDTLLEVRIPNPKGKKTKAIRLRPLYLTASLFFVLKDTFIFQTQKVSHYTTSSPIFFRFYDTMVAQVKRANSHTPMQVHGGLVMVR